MKTFWPDFDIGLCQSGRDSSNTDATCRKMLCVSDETKQVNSERVDYSIYMLK